MYKFLKDIILMEGLDKKEIEKIVELSVKIKRTPMEYSSKLKGVDGLCLFQRSSSRTRYSFHRAVLNMGGSYVELPWQTSFMELLPVCGADIDVEMKSFAAQGVKFMLVRQGSQEFVEALAKYSPFSIFNGCTSEEHPLQALTDYMTLKENFRDLQKIDFVFLGNATDPVFRSLAHLFFSVGIRMNFVGPRELFDDSFFKKYHVQAFTDLSEVKADVIYLNQLEYDKKQIISGKYKITKKNIGERFEEIKIMHCLPNGSEASASLLNGKNSFCYKQAENRTYIQQAVLLLCLGLI